MIEYSEDEARIVRLTTFKAGKEEAFQKGRKHGVLEVVDDLKKIVSQNKSEQECYKDILSYIY